jgi:hypothetical protein
MSQNLCLDCAINKIKEIKDLRVDTVDPKSYLHKIESIMKA